MAKLEQRIQHCGGGMVQFGISGQSQSIYMTKFQLCVSPFQDALYGKGLRLHNAQGSSGSSSGSKAIGHFRCTVCGSGHGICRP